MRRATFLFVFALSVAAAASPSPALAQNDPIGAFFRSLFGGQQRQQQPQQPQAEAPKPQQQVKPKRTEPVEPKIVEQPKAADAQAVLVIGDEQAIGLAEGLKIAFADSPSIEVFDKAKDNSGLVRDVPFDWPGKLPGLLAERKYDFVVVMMGENDRNTFPAAVTGGKAEEVRSEKWEAAYRDKLKRVTGLIKDYGKPFFWVGLPPLERPSLSAFASYLNGLTKAAAEQAGGMPIDSWNGFVDEDGHFSYLGPDIDGQEKRLRSYDGLHFTRAGERKLAYYVETEIRKLARGERTAPEPLLPEVQAALPKQQAAMLAAPPPLPPAPWAKVGPVIPLDGSGDTDTELAGAPVIRGVASLPETAPPETMPGGYPMTETPLYRRLIMGEPIAPDAGRVDDYAWAKAP